MNVQNLDVPRLWDSRRALERGHVDGSGTTTVEILLAQKIMEQPAPIFLLLHLSQSADVLRGDASRNSLSDLAGKTLSLEPSNLELVFFPLYVGSS